MKLSTNKQLRNIRIVRKHRRQAAKKYQSRFIVNMKEIKDSIRVAMQESVGPTGRA